MKDIKTLGFTGPWEGIDDNIDYLNGYEAVLTIVDDIKKGYDTVRLVTKSGIFILPENQLRKVDQVIEFKAGGLTFKPIKAYLCKLVISEKAKMIFFREIVFPDGAEIRLKKSEQPLIVNKLCVISDFLGQSLLEKKQKGGEK